MLSLSANSIERDVDGEYLGGINTAVIAKGSDDDDEASSCAQLV